MLPKKGHLHFETEIGVQYFSAPTVAYTFSGTGCQNYTRRQSTPTAAPFNHDRRPSTSRTSYRTTSTDLRFYPILSFGLSYRIH